jgi:hypothetical protein
MIEGSNLRHGHDGATSEEADDQFPPRWSAGYCFHFPSIRDAFLKGTTHVLIRPDRSHANNSRD